MGPGDDVERSAWELDCQRHATPGSDLSVGQLPLLRRSLRLSITVSSSASSRSLHSCGEGLGCGRASAFQGGVPSPAWPAEGSPSAWPGFRGPRHDLGSPLVS
jgi:hypothetical protein